MKIVLTGGGTAGHIIPNIALIDDLQKHFDEIFYIGSGKQLEKDLILPYNIKYFSIETPKLVRKFTFKNMVIPLKLITSINDCKRILKDLSPDVVFSKGGYVSLPVVVAAHKLGIKVLAHESDLTMGLANKISKWYCNKICTTFDSTAKGKKFVCTGAPIRKEFKKFDAAPAFKNKLPTILFVGGSQGAAAINKFILENLDTLTLKYNIIHLCGKGKSSGAKHAHYIEIEFSNDMPTLINQCDVVFTRGGSNALFEILAVNKPMIIYPLSKKESRGDQIENAKYFEQRNLGAYIHNLDINTLIDVIDNSIKNKTRIENHQKTFYKAGNKNILNEIISLARNWVNIFTGWTFHLKYTTLKSYYTLNMVYYMFIIHHI